MLKKDKFNVDTFEKAIDFYEAMKLYNSVERMSFIIDLYPELLKCTQQDLAELIGMERETVNRTLKKIKGGNYVR